MRLRVHERLPRAGGRPTTSRSARGAGGSGDGEGFSFALDVRAARKARFRPLPVRVAVEAYAPSDLPTELPVAAAAPPPLPPPFPVPSPAPSAGPEALSPAKVEAVRTRLDTWKRRLLDLSLRNRLLNFTDTKKTLRILTNDVAAFEDALASGKAFRVLARPPASDPQADPRDPARVRERTGEDALASLVASELAAGRLYADVPEADLEGRLIDLHRAARLSFDEGGANILHVAIGFVRWFESRSSEQARMAPILLLPLAIERPSVAQGFRLSLADEDPQLNETLLQKLEHDFGVDTKGLRDLPDDAAGLDVNGLLRRFREALRDVPRWEVVSEVRVGLFTFTKFLMWKDLDERSERLLQSPVVSHLVRKPGTAFEPGAVFPAASRLDAERRVAATYCPLDADSSQLAAVFAAADGRTFVLEGPPGTGKSQTIANLIAQTLSEGRTVLFVSEKMAALQVVYERLRKVGLAPFCLELHSSKAKKLDIVRQLGAALQASGLRAAGRVGRARGEARGAARGAERLRRRAPPRARVGRLVLRRDRDARAARDSDPRAPRLRRARRDRARAARGDARGGRCARRRRGVGRRRAERLAVRGRAALGLGALAPDRRRGGRRAPDARRGCARSRATRVRRAARLRADRRRRRRPRAARRRREGAARRAGRACRARRGARLRRAPRVGDRVDRAGPSPRRRARRSRRPLVA